MKLLPIENITYRTRLDEAEIIKRLSEITEPSKPFRFGSFGSGATKPYAGRITGRAFEIKRILGYRNSFAPLIKGSIVKSHDGLTIKVKMRLPVLVTVFLAIWCGGVAIACMAVLIGNFGFSTADPTAFIPFGMLLFAYILTLGGFKFESNKSKRDLQQLFGTAIDKGMQGPLVSNL